MLGAGGRSVTMIPLTKNDGVMRHLGNVDRGMPDTGFMLLSILICTRNRETKLKQALQSVLALEFPPGADYELIVVDNGSTDGTGQVCASLAPLFNGRMRVVYEPKPGLGRARSLAASIAAGEIAACIDDDIVPDRNWLKVIHREFSADPSLQGISGRVELLNPMDLPMTIRRSMQRVEAQAVSEMYDLFVGCNMAVRADLLGRVGSYDPDFGAGSLFLSAEDTDFWYRCWRHGAKLVYVPELLVYHDHGRRSLEDKRKLARAYTSGRGSFFAKHFWHDINVMKDDVLGNPPRDVGQVRMGLETTGLAVSGLPPLLDTSSVLLGQGVGIVGG